MNSVKNDSSSKLVFTISLLTAIFWILGQLIDVYYFAVSGAIFEILWLPMIGCLFVLPVLSLIFWVKENFNQKSLYLYSIIILLTTALFVYFNS